MSGKTKKGMNTTKSGGPRYFVKSLEKGLRVLETIAAADSPLSLQEIARSLHYNPATTFRFLFTLEKIGFVEHDKQRKTYKLSPRVLSLGHAVFRSSNLWQTAHPYLVETSQKLTETMNMAILDGTEILYIDRIMTESILRVNLEIGSKLPAYCTSMGRVLLSGQLNAKVREILENSERVRLTSRTLTSIEEIEREIENVRHQGYALNDGEMAPELKSIAAPVKNADGEIIAAVNIAVNASQYDVPKMKEVLLPELRKVTKTISMALGYQG